MKLKQLLNGCIYEFKTSSTNLDQDIQTITFDSRKVTSKDLFVCLVGYKTNAHQYINDVINKGCRAIVISEELPSYPKGVCFIKVQNTRETLAYLSANFFDHPAQKLTTIAVTGTKGKTSITSFLKGLIKEDVGTIGTLGTYIKDSFEPTINTTPESFEIQRLMAKMVDAGCRYCILEASSQGLKHHRLDGIQFNYGIFTNLSNDHIGPGEHPNFEDYLQSKAQLFKHCDIGIVNVDDIHVDDLMREATCQIYTYGHLKNANLSYDNLQEFQNDQRLGLTMHTSGIIDTNITLSMPGTFNAYNLLPCLLLCHLEGIPTTTLQKRAQQLSVPGRLELVDVDTEATVMIDFAHNGISTLSVLDILSTYHFNTIYCVYGSVGDRSQTRRYDIGEAVSRHPNTFSILTSDNPGYESLRSINKDIISGINSHQGHYIEIDDREEAIIHALQHAKANDLVLILGKGHERYQLIKNEKQPFDELAILHNYKR